MLNKIGVLQFVVILYLSRIFSTLSYNSGITVEGGVPFFLGAVLSLVFQILLLMPAIILYYKSSKKDVVMCAYDTNIVFGHVVSFFYFAALLFISFNVVVDTVFLMDNTIYTGSSSIPLTIMLIVACSYAAISGIEAISRSAFLIFVIFIFFTVILFVLLSSEVKMYNFRPILDSPFEKTIKAGFNNFARNSELIALILLLPYVKSDPKKGVIWFFILTFVTFETVIFFLITVLGDYSVNLVFPFYNLISISNLSVFEHLDPVHIGIWAFIAFIKVSMYLYLAIKCFCRILPKKFKKVSAPISILILFLAVIPVRYSLKSMFIINNIINSGIIPIIFVFVIPSLIFIMLKIKKGKYHEKEAYSNNAVSNYV